MRCFDDMLPLFLRKTNLDNNGIKRYSMDLN